jgi:FG-GAP repeat
MTNPVRTALLFAACLLLCPSAARSQQLRSEPRPAASAGRSLQQTAFLKASNAEAGDHFGSGGPLEGHAVAISGDGNTIAVGAPTESSGSKGMNGDQADNSAYSAGAVYVFTRAGAGWLQQAYLKASNTGQSDNFGYVVALSENGDTLAVSAYFEASAATGVNGDQNDDSLPQAGAVYVFTRAAGTWSQQAYLKASNTGRAPNPSDPNDWGDGDQFGFSLALSADGNTLAASAPSEDSRASGINTLAFQQDDSSASSGAVYVFARTGTVWSQQAYVKASNSDAGDLFGYSVGLSADGNTMAVSGYDEDGSPRQVNGIPDNLRGGSGAVYVFGRQAGAWSQQAYLKAANAERNDSLGFAVSISQDGNTIAGGAADEDCLKPGVNIDSCDNDMQDDTSAGAVYVWFRENGVWRQQAFLKASNPSQNDNFGARLMLSGDGNTLAVGSQLEDGSAQGINGKEDDDAEEAGAIYFYTRTAGAWKQVAYVKGSNTEAFDEFGSAMALNRDGSILVVGARGEDSASQGTRGDLNDNSADEAGAVYVFTY